MAPGPLPRPTLRRTGRVLAAAGFGALLATGLAGCGGGSPAATGEVPASGSRAPTAPSSPPRAASRPLTVETVAGGLEHGWDVGFLPGGTVLVAQRPAKLALVSGTRPGATVTPVTADLADVMVRGEGGLMGLVVHPDFGTSRLFTTCQTHTEHGEPVDIRLVTWRLADDGRSATRVRDLLTGLPLNPSGRHSGCRPTLAADGSLLVGTGDTANGAVSQDRASLGGKVLRINLTTGAPVPGNPFIASSNPRERLIWTYGHRNVQGVAVRPGTGQVFTAEHGPTFNDEVNLLRPGGNYGWDPSRGGTVGGYDESVAMTDRARFPDAVDAVWQSGATTQAVCAAAFLSGRQWGELDGALVITALKGAKLLVLTLDRAGAVSSVAIPPEFDHAFGRLRAARLGPDGALYVTTTNGTDDKLLRVTPA
ncbi:MAG TPA: PQQ-dependent sugar dehydrogenase [Kineosporiaceae bacterium]